MATEIRVISDTVTLAGFPSWPVPPISLQAGVGSFDLKPTIPAGVPAGGVFGSQAPLPAGWSLSTAGVLTLAAGTAAKTTPGIVFTYTITQ